MTRADSKARSNREQTHVSDNSNIMWWSHILMEDTFSSSLHLTQHIHKSIMWLNIAFSFCAPKKSAKNYIYIQIFFYSQDVCLCMLYLLESIMTWFALHFHPLSICAKREFSSRFLFVHLCRNLYCLIVRCMDRGKLSFYGWWFEIIFYGLFIWLN